MASEDILRDAPKCLWQAGCGTAASRPSGSPPLRPGQLSTFAPPSCRCLVSLGTFSSRAAVSSRVPESAENRYQSFTLGSARSCRPPAGCRPKSRWLYGCRNTPALLLAPMHGQHQGIWEWSRGTRALQQLGDSDRMAECGPAIHQSWQRSGGTTWHGGPAWWSCWHSLCCWSWLSWQLTWVPTTSCCSVNQLSMHGALWAGSCEGSAPSSWLDSF